VCHSSIIIRQSPTIGEQAVVVPHGPATIDPTQKKMNIVTMTTIPAAIANA
jgi:hypothetical protein